MGLLGVCVAFLAGAVCQENLAESAQAEPKIQVSDGKGVLTISKFDPDIQVVVKRQIVKELKLKVDQAAGKVTCHWQGFEIEFGSPRQPLPLEVEFAQAELARQEKVAALIAERLRKLQAEGKASAKLLESLEKAKETHSDELRKAVETMIDLLRTAGIRPGTLGGQPVTIEQRGRKVKLSCKGRVIAEISEDRR